MRKLRFVVAGLALALLSVAPAEGAPGAPTASTPAAGSTVAFLPAFGWNAVAGASRYEFEIAADQGFNAPVLGSNFDHFFTRNTRATLTKVVPNGTYWWHVRSVGADGSVSAWSSARSFTRRWASAPSLSEPANGATITFPADPFKLEWTPVAGAAKYAVSVATDPTLGSIVWAGGQPIVTQATAFTLSSPLAPDQTYYWGVTPVDAAGNPGTPSPVWSFMWRWPSATTPAVTDIATAPEIFDYEFSWNPVPGAAGYELEVNSSVDFATGSRVCCPVNPITGLTTIGTSYSPTIALQNNNAYYWRVRAVDPSGNAGVWNGGAQFSKGFDNVLPTIRNLRMLDNPFPTEGNFETSTPIVTWDPVPGASAYEVEVTRFAGGCQWSANTEHWRNKTATTAWTALGSGWNGIKPFESSWPVGTDIPALVAGHAYCVRVTALDRPSDLLSPYIRSVETYLPDSTTPAFEWTGPPAGGACSPSCNLGALGAGDYLVPTVGQTKQSMPYLRWNPISGAASYFVLVSKDPHFSNLVDYAFTKIPAYAPRTGFGPRTYPDETNLYYWAVLPSTEGNGSGVVTAPQFSAPSNFQKQSTPPTLLEPAIGALFSAAVRFRWAPTEGARRYHLQVSQDPTFSGGLIAHPELFFGTDSTAYTSSVTYPADTNLYWRVRADNEDGVGLTWSAVGQFRKTLATPVPDVGNPTGGDAIPSWRWSAVPGAISYDVRLIPPNNVTLTFNNVPSFVATPTLMKGTGIWKLQARANFPQVGLAAPTDGPWSPLMPFTRTIREPANATEEVGTNRLVLRWDPKIGAFNYRVQVSSREDFSMPLFDAPLTTDNPTYSPWLSSPAYAAGGVFYWRVAAADDAVANVGDFTATRSFTLPPLSTSTGTTTQAASSITLTVQKTTARIKARGVVSPPHPGRQVTVKLFRKRNGVWVLLSTKRPTLSSTSGYGTWFGRPRPGACKVTTRFAGDTDHLTSSRAVSFRC